MKKNRWMLSLLAVVLVVQAFAIPVTATEVTTDPTAAVLPQETEPVEIPFGQVSIQNGCRTIAGMSPLAGKERKLNTAQGVFVYETNTDTVIYSYMPTRIKSYERRVYSAKRVCSLQSN